MLRSWETYPCAVSGLERLRQGEFILGTKATDFCRVDICKITPCSCGKNTQRPCSSSNTCTYSDEVHDKYALRTFRLYALVNSSAKSTSLGIRHWRRDRGGGIHEGRESGVGGQGGVGWQWPRWRRSSMRERAKGDDLTALHTTSDGRGAARAAVADGGEGVRRWHKRLQEYRIALVGAE